MTQQEHAGNGTIAALRERFGPHVELAARTLRRLARVVLIAGLVLASGGSILAIGGTAAMIATGRLRAWLGIVLAVLWLFFAWFAVWRVRRIDRAVHSTDTFTAQFYEALDLAGAWAAVSELMGGASTDGGWVARRSWARRLVRVFKVVRIPADRLEKVRELPQIAPFLPGSLLFTRASMYAAVVASILCPLIAILATVLAW